VGFFLGGGPEILSLPHSLLPRSLSSFQRNRKPASDGIDASLIIAEGRSRRSNAGALPARFINAADPVAVRDAERMKVPVASKTASPKAKPKAKAKAKAAAVEYRYESEEEDEEEPPQKAKPKAKSKAKPKPPVMESSDEEYESEEEKPKAKKARKQAAVAIAPEPQAVGGDGIHGNLSGHSYEQLRGLNVPILKNIAKGLKLSNGGTKGDLVDRIVTGIEPWVDPVGEVSYEWDPVGAAPAILCQQFAKSAERIYLDIRLSHARILVQRSDKSIRDIASETGFASPAHLTARYTPRFGAPPRKDRTQRQQGLAFKERLLS
jgi:hypothetical protein